MIVKNPSDKKVTIGIDGTNYSVEAETSIPVPDAIAEEWVKTHQFLQLSPGAATEKVPEVSIEKTADITPEKVVELSENKEVKKETVVSEKPTKKEVTKK